MASSRPTSRPATLLEKWLEDVPNSNNRTASVKKERKEFTDVFASSFSFNSPALGQATHSSQSAAKASESSNKSTALLAEVKVEAPQIDSSSSKGLFGWETVKDAALPVIFREDERLVPVRIVETKIIQKFSETLPWTVFSCINIRSYYVTEKEATLLNEINSLHCDYFFGYDQFTVKDVVVCFQDVLTLHKFLETSREIFQMGLAKSRIDWLGFVNISGSLIVPYVAKPHTGGQMRRFVPESLVQSNVLLVKVEKAEMNEWDCSYLRMLLIYSGVEGVQIKNEDQLCLVSDLKWDSSLCPLHIEECSPPGTKVSSTSTPKIATPKSEFGHHSHRQPAPAHTQHPSHLSQSHLDDPNWLLSNSNSPNPALRTLHQISRTDIAGVSLNAINLKPYSAQQAVFVGDLVTKMFRGVSVLTAHYILEKILQVKLYECTRLHEDAFTRAGRRPLQGDKLVLVEVLRKCIAQFKQIILAGLGGTSQLAYPQ